VVSLQGKGITERLVQFQPVRPIHSPVSADENLYHVIERMRNTAPGPVSGPLRSIAFSRQVACVRDAPDGVIASASSRKRRSVSSCGDTNRSPRCPGRSESRRTPSSCTHPREKRASVANVDACRLNRSGFCQKRRALIIRMHASYGRKRPLAIEGMSTPNETSFVRRDPGGGMNPRTSSPIRQGARMRSRSSVHNVDGSTSPSASPKRPRPVPGFSVEVRSGRAQARRTPLHSRVLRRHTSGFTDSSMMGILVSKRD
jgi:hypothetical protein